MQRNTSLENLTIQTCSISRPLSRVSLPVTLKFLCVFGCEKLEFFLPELFNYHHPSLRFFLIYHSTCDSFLSLPLGNFPRCDYLEIRYLEGLEFLSISTSDRDLSSFDELHLHISQCPNLVSVSCKNMKASYFRSLMLEDCPELIFPIQGLPSSLTSLSIANCNKFTSGVEFGLQGLPSLTYLQISYLQNLRSLDSLKLQLLTSLQKLDIRSCPNLQSY